MTKHEHFNSMTYQDVEIIERKRVYQGYFAIDRYRLRFRLYNGGWSNVIDREIFERGQSVTLLPYDPILDQVVLIEQFRPGAINAINNKQSPWLIEIVAGVVEDNERITTVAKREAKEEANLEVKDLYLIGDYWASPGGSSEKVTAYCGYVDAKNVAGVFGLADESEDIKVNAVSITECMSLIKSSQIKNAHTIISLQWLLLNHKFIKNYWITIRN